MTTAESQSRYEQQWQSSLNRVLFPISCKCPTTFITEDQANQIPSYLLCTEKMVVPCSVAGAYPTYYPLGFYRKTVVIHRMVWNEWANRGFPPRKLPKELKK